MKIPIVFRQAYQAIRLMRFVPFYNKERRTVQIFKEFSKDPGHPGDYRFSGIPKNEFLIFLLTKPITAKMLMGNIPNKYSWIFSDGEKYLNYAIDTGYIKELAGNKLKVSSRGDRYVERSYYWKKIFWGPAVTKVILPFVSIPLLALFIAWLSSIMFGFRIDAFQFYGVSAVRRPELNYVYAKQFDGFVSIKNRGVEPKEIEWILPTNKTAYNFEDGNSPSPFILETRDIKALLYEQVLFNRKGGGYSEKELKDGIECEVIPLLAKRGIPAGVKIDYSNEGNNEIHTMRDLVFIQGVGSNLPKVEVKARNVSYKEWNNFLEEEGKRLDSTLEFIANTRGKHKDDSGHCLIKYGYPDSFI